MSDERIRTFVAIELPDNTRSRLAQTQQRLRTAMPEGVGWVRPEGIHLTLKFLGEVPATLVPEIRCAVSEVCRAKGPFSLSIAGLGVFPSNDRPRVIWIGVGGEVGKLVKLQAGIDSALERFGFGRESRPFAAHLTLGRVQERTSTDLRRRIGELVEASGLGQVDSFVAETVSIMQSTLRRGGAIYSRLAAIGL